MPEAFYLDDSVTSLTSPVKAAPGAPAVTPEALADVAVYYYTEELPAGLDAIFEANTRNAATVPAEENKKRLGDQLKDLAAPYLEKFHCKAYDVLNNNPTVVGGDAAFDALAAKHFTEHLHEDDEIRFVLQGSGYFDIRDAADRWVRVKVFPGDLLVVPAGIYHRYATDEKRSIVTMRIFKENASWQAVTRGPDSEANAVRQRFVKNVLHAPRVTAAGVADPAQNIYQVIYPWKLSEEVNAATHRYYEKLLTAAGADWSAALAKAQIYIFMTGSIEQHLGYSWCPYCNPAKVTVHEGLVGVKATNAARNGALFPKNENILYVELPVQRKSYLLNPQYPYRTHPILKVHSVPTLVLLRPRAAFFAALKGKTAAEAIAAVKSAKWEDLVEEVRREHNPKPEFFSGP